MNISMRMKKSLYCMIAIVISLMVLLLFPKMVRAEEPSLHMNRLNENDSVLVVFDSRKNIVNEKQRMLDMVLGQFAQDIDFKNSSELTADDIKGKTHLIYFGVVEEKIPNEAVKIISSFRGPKIGIGYNVEQLGEEFSFVNMKGKQVVNQLTYSSKVNNALEKVKKIDPETIIEVSVEKNVNVLATAKGEKGNYPFIMQQGTNYYVASNSIFPPNSVFLTQVLNQVFEVKESSARPAYIRLEDVNPLTNPDNLMAIAKELKKREIPYMIATTPVYYDPETKEISHFEDYPEVIKALKYMQKNGGSIILHGYSHRFSDSSEDKGFEFWDEENQMPIYSATNNEENQISEFDFGSHKEYLAAVKENQKYETNYITDRVTKGVQELANYGLYPLAFESPHYGMSQHGYDVTSEFFSTYVGQVQLSDDNHEIINTVPYASTPSFLNGMLLLPETIDYIDSETKEPFNYNLELSSLNKVTDNSILGGSHHPYLGMEGLVPLLNEMEKTSNIVWIDLKELDNTVKVENVSIKSQDGEITADIDHLGLLETSIEYPKYQLIFGLNKVIWVMAIVGILSVSLLFIFIIKQKSRENKE